MSDTSFNFALNNVTNVIATTKSATSNEISVLELVTCDQPAVTLQVGDNVSLASQHPFYVFKKHRCSNVNKDLEIIQQALPNTSSVEKKDPKVEMVEKKEEKLEY